MPVRFQVDPDFYDHPKVLGMSDAAFALWVRAGSYSAAKTSDGFVSDDALSLFSTTQQEAARELVRRGLWKRARGGFRFHQWGQRNLLRERIEAEREADRERKRRERLDAKKNGKPHVDSNIVRPDSTPDSGGNPDGVRPLSVSVSVSESVSGLGRDSPTAGPSPPNPSPEPPHQCPKHIDERNPPKCGACADARRNHDVWLTAKNTWQDAATKCRRHRGQIAANCALCRSERLAAPEESAADA